MSLVPSLLQAIVRIDGEALVMHVGDKPYVVSPKGQVDLATRGLTFDAVAGLLNQLLPQDSQRALDEFGAAQYELPGLPEFPGEHFTVVAARGGDDVWVEIRRRKVPDDDLVPMELFGPTGTTTTAAAPARGEDRRRVTGESPAAHEAETEHELTFDESDDLTLPKPDEMFGEAESRREPVAAPASADHEPAWHPLAAVHPAETTPVAMPSTAAPSAAEPEQPDTSPAPAEPVWTPAPVAVHEPDAVAVAVPQTMPITAATNDSGAVAPPHAPAPVTASAPEPVATVSGGEPASGGSERLRVVEPSHGVVLPLTKNPIRAEAPPPLGEQSLSGLDRLLRLAAARGASTLYLSSSAGPSVRVDGQIQVIEGAPVLSPNAVESLLLTLMPERNAEALRTGVASEWIVDLPDLGRVRCMRFRDHRGPGGVFRIMPMRPVTAEQLGLSREIQALATEPEGLVLIVGPRSSGKRTLIAGLVDLINRTRRDHVITIEREINIVHERAGSFISQREARGGLDDMAAVGRAALREDPDVLVLEELRSAALMNVALDAAASGQLVIGGFPAHNATDAVDRIIDLYPPEQRRQVQLSLAQSLRGVVAQVLLRKNRGGRLAAREVLLNTPAVASVLAEGKTSQLPLAIEGGRKHGMVPMNDALVAFVQSGVVEAREAYGRSTDRAGFLALLNRQGIDTSFAERLA